MVCVLKTLWPFNCITFESDMKMINKKISEYCHGHFLNSPSTINNVLLIVCWICTWFILFVCFFIINVLIQPIMHKFFFCVLVTNIETNAYIPDKYCLNIWVIENWQAKICLCIDDFSVNYFNKQDAEHSFSSLQQNYHITINWTGSHFLWLKYNLKLRKRWVDISMYDYAVTALHKLQYGFPRQPQLALHEWTGPIYGQSCQYAKDADISPLLDKTSSESRRHILILWTCYW